MSAMINIDEELNLAINSSDISILHKLKRNVNTVVRRALATNVHTPKEILDTLAYDPVLNVSYMAIQNPSCSIKREFNHILYITSQFIFTFGFIEIFFYILKLS